MNAIAIKACGLFTAFALVTQGHAAYAQKIVVKSGNFKDWTFGGAGTDGGTELMAVTKAVGEPPPACVQPELEENEK